MISSRISIMPAQAILSLCILFLLSLNTFATEPSVDNTATYIDKGQYRWKIFVKADQSTLNQIEYVEYILPPTFPNQRRRVDKLLDKKYPFYLTELASSEFSIKVKIKYKSKDRSPSSFTYQLKLFTKK
ncbi:MAG TPA: pYEATS domain-containing protein [Pyrinomonadaceae bacterium]|jgi:transcription initiation factor IIF auxiliary subunit